MFFEMVYFVRTKAGYAWVSLLSAGGLCLFGPGRLQINGCHAGRGGGTYSTNDLIVFFRLLGQGKDGMDGFVLG
jgi:hypothetical protein